MKRVDLSSYDNSFYDPGAGRLRRDAWHLVNTVFMRSRVIRSSRWRVAALKLFGAKLGHGVVVRPEVNIKFPWRLEIGEHSWLAEKAWIRCVDHVRIGSHCAVSQSAFIGTGNHDWKRTDFRLMVAPIVLEDGVWVGAKAIVAPGVRMRTHSVLTAGSVLTSDAEPYTIYQGNPAVAVRRRRLD